MKLYDFNKLREKDKIKLIAFFMII